VKFDVFLEDNGKKLDILIRHPGFPSRPIEGGSGAEKIISSIAIRIALIKVCNLPKGNLLILDEPFTGVDNERLEGLIKILSILKSEFEIILLISHSEILKEVVDTEIEIEYKNKFAHINQ
jgi:DNA repair exonuclease SbcCD ATPase subunit